MGKGTLWSGDAQKEVTIMKNSLDSKMVKVSSFIMASMVLIFAVCTVAEAQQPRVNHLIAMLEAKQNAYGIFSQVRDFRNARALGSSKLDFIIYDTEHQPFDMDTFMQFLQNLKGPDGKFKVTPLIRVAPNAGEIRYNQWVVKQALDLGAMGILFAHVDTQEEAIQAIISMRYPPTKRDPGAPAEPRGFRGWSPGIAAGTWGMSVYDYGQVADVWPLNPKGELLAYFLIESKMAFENLKDIISVPGVGAIFLGAGDFQCDLGYRGQGTIMAGKGAPARMEVQPEAEEWIQRGLAIWKERKAGTVPGISCLTTSLDVLDRVRQGFNMPTIGGDVGLTADTAKCLQLLGR
jgi:4-hydroxy-2-oxoheptanedioate aldolase